MNNNKFKTLEEQIKILKSKNMIISEKDKKELLHFNYAYIIYNYSSFFLSSDAKNYKKGTKLKDLIEFWKFERELMSWIMPYILKFEHIFKSTMVYVLAKINPFAHYGNEVYDENKIKNKLELKRKIISKEIFYLDKNDDKYLINNKVPIWILINELSFNELILMFGCLDNKYQINILEKMEYVDKKEKFSKHCRTIKKYRNRESHNKVIHYPFRLKNSKNWRYLNDCILGLSKISENKNIKIKLTNKFYETYKNNELENKLEWLKNIYKIEISNEINQLKNK